MTLLTDMAADLAAAIFDTDTGMAVAATWRAWDGVEDVAIAAVVSYGQGDEYEGADNYGIRATMRVRVSDVAEVHSKDMIVIGETMWRVLGADLSSDGLVWIIQANKVTA